MDPNAAALIVSALSAGIQSATGEAAKDAYTRLKALLQHKFAGKAEAEKALIGHEKNPDMWKALLSQELQETKADQDQDIIVAAQQVLQLVHLRNSKHTNITFNGPAQGTIVGDHLTITQTYGDIAPEK